MSKIPVLPGFESVHHHWDSKYNLYIAKVLPGEFYVSNNQELISTTLGSCVSACIRDPDAKIGGLNHFMLPIKGDARTSGNADTSLDNAARYGNWAMEHLINEILKNGGTRRNLEIKLFGGGKILSSLNDVGQQNIKFIEQYIYDENLKIAARDLGGNTPRKILYHPISGKVMLKKIERVDNNVCEQEEKYAKSIRGASTSGSVDLF